MSIPALSPLAAFVRSSLLAVTTLTSFALVCGSLSAQPFVRDGTMPIGKSYDTPLYAQGDLDGDGWEDVIVCSTDSTWGTGYGQYLATLMGNGAGFDPPTIYADPDFFHNDLELVDVDGDGDLDVVAVGRTVDTVGSNPGWVTVFLNSGGGVLAPPSYLSLPEIPRSLAAADLDGDGRVDLAVVADDGVWPYSSWVLILSNDGDGGFLPPTTIDLPSVAGHVTAGDLDGDGDVDLVVSCSGGLSLLLNDGLGGFEVSSNTPGDPWPTTYRFASIEDVDADGHQDVITINTVNCGWLCDYWYLVVFPGDGSGGFEEGVTLLSEYFDSFEGGGLPSSILSGDLDDDGDLDFVLLGDFVLQRSWWLENLGDFAFQDHFLWAPTSGGLIDYDGDGAPDLVGMMFLYNPLPLPPGLYWWHNNFVARFTTFEHHMTAVEPVPSYVFAEDMDGDGDQDIVDFHEWGELHVFANDGGGSLSLLSTAPLTVSPYSVQAADADGDDDMDVVVRGDGDVEVFLNDGGGYLALAAVLPSPTDYSKPFTLGDLDGDDLPEIIAVYRSSDGGGFYVFHQTAPGVFELGETYGENDLHVEDVQVGDTDGDGHDEVVFRYVRSAAYEDSIHGFGVFNGDVDGLIEPVELEVVGKGDGILSWKSIVVADCDEDGLDDVVLTCVVEGSPHIRVYLAEAGSVLPLLTHDDVIDVDGFDDWLSVSITAITDLDADGSLDVLGVVKWGGFYVEQIEVTWLNDGAGQLTETEHVSMPGEAFSGIGDIGDINGDGSPDLVMTSGNAVIVRLNDGEGRFPDATWFWVPELQGSPLLTPMDANGTADLLVGTREELTGQSGLSVFLSVHEGTPPGPCELDFNGDGFVTQADHAQIAPEVDGIYYATWTYLYRPDWFELYFPDVDPAMLDWNGDGEITLEEVAPNVPFSTDSYYWQWLVYLLRDWIIENYGIDYYAEWWPDSGCE